MRTQIKVTDLNARQWEHLTTEVPVNGRDFLQGDSRVCVTFYSNTNLELHIEMGITEFSTLLLRLRNIERETIALPQIEPEYVARIDRPAYGYDKNGSVVALDQDGNS